MGRAKQGTRAKAAPTAVRGTNRADARQNSLQAVADKAEAHLHSKFAGRNYIGWKALHASGEETKEAAARMEHFLDAGLNPRYVYDWAMSDNSAGVKHEPTYRAIENYLRTRIASERTMLIDEGVRTEDDRALDTSMTSAYDEDKWEMLIAADLIHMRNELLNGLEELSNEEQSARRHLATHMDDLSRRKLPSALGAEAKLYSGYKEEQMRTLAIGQDMLDPNLADFRKTIYEGDFLDQHRKAMPDANGNVNDVPIFAARQDTLNLFNGEGLNTYGFYTFDTKAISLSDEHAQQYAQMKAEGTLSPLILHEILHSHQIGEYKLAEDMAVSYLNHAFLEGATELYTRQKAPELEPSWIADIYPPERGIVQAMADYADEQGKITKEQFIKTLAYTPHETRVEHAAYMLYGRVDHEALNQLKQAIWAPRFPGEAAPSFDETRESISKKVKDIPRILDIIAPSYDFMGPSAKDKWEAEFYSVID